MPKIFGNLAGLKLNLVKVKAALHDELSATLVDATKAWVQTAERIIPMWSGASRATLKTLAGKVGINIATFPVPGSSGKMPPNRSAEGEAKGDGELEMNRGTLRYHFSYTTDLDYLIRNETRNMNAAMLGRLRTQTPYRFRQQANGAFNAVISRRLSRLPVGSILRKSISTILIRSK